MEGRKKTEKREGKERWGGRSGSSWGGGWLSKVALGQRRLKDKWN